MRLEFGPDGRIRPDTIRSTTARARAPPGGRDGRRQHERPPAASRRDDRSRGPATTIGIMDAEDQQFYEARQNRAASRSGERAGFQQWDLAGCD